MLLNLANTGHTNQDPAGYTGGIFTPTYLGGILARQFVLRACR